MRPGFFNRLTSSDRSRGHRGRSQSQVRKSKLRRMALEGLEPRTLLSTLPAPSIIGRANVSSSDNITEDNSDESSPSIAVNPLNPNHLVSSWTRYDIDFDADRQIFIEAAVSTNGGASWSSLSVPGRRVDPSSGDDPTLYPTIDNASVAFARDGTFYLLSSQHNGDTAGELVLRHYAANGNVLNTYTAYQWNRSAEGQERDTSVRHPVLAIDNTAPTFVDPNDPAGNVDNPHSGNIYITFIGETPPPEEPPDPYNPLTVDLIRSTDQGATFSGRLVLNQGGNGGDQRNTTPRIAVSQGGGSSQPGQVTVVWDDFASGVTLDPPRSFVRARQVLNGGATLGTQSNVASTFRVLGNEAGGGSIGGLTANGIGPQPSIAVDNTLGAFSPYQGRIYVAYTGRHNSDDPNNPPDNTDIFLAYSDNGGASWTNAGRVNDDLGDRDGFSGADHDLGIPTAGRPQFMPEVAVDPSTGSLVVQFYDTRHDASRGRAATYITASIDGGSNFSPQVFVNQPETVFDVATGTNRVVGPIPDNQTGGNPNTDGTFGYGTRQGLAVLGGNIYTAWSGNINGGPNGLIFLDIRAARAVTAAGPRIIDGTAGVVLTTGTNDTPEAREFIVEFDRPINASTFSTNDVSIRYQSPDGSVAEPISATNVVQLSSTRFRVEFPRQTRPGTYSYAVGPNIEDLSGNLMDQDADGIPGEAQEDRFAMPGVAGGGTPLTGPFLRESLPLIVPGPRAIGTRPILSDGTLGPDGSSVIDGKVTGIEITFDRDMQVDTFTVEDVLRIVGPAGELDRSSFQVSAVNSSNGVARAFRVSFAEQQLSGTYQVLLGSNIQSTGGHLIDSNQNAGVDVLRGGSVTLEVELSFASTEVPQTIPGNGSLESTLLVDKNFEIADVDLQLNIDHGNVPDLRAELIAPDGQVVLLFDGVGATGDRMNFTNTIFDSQAGEPIGNGTPPFSDRYRPQSSLTVLNSPIGSPTEGGTYTLRITNSGGTTGTLRSWRLIMKERVTGTGVGEPVADRIRADFSIFTMNPEDGLSSSTWTPIGPASIESGEGAGRVSAIAVDPSDPSGNTVYLGAASGGVWKTNDFLTTDPGGPTWIPLTDAVAANGLNIGGIAVFGRNNDPNQSIVLVATGEGDTNSPGVGFLRSMDGGSSWELLDSADNRVPFADREAREFVGTTAFKLVVDPRPTSTGQAIFYAALSGPEGGLWRSTDSGDTWARLRAGQATDVLLDPGSGTPSVNNPTGNLQILYAAFRGEGVFISPNQGQQLNLMAGGVGKPQIRDGDIFDPPTVPVTDGGVAPSGDGRIVLAKPHLTNNDRQDSLYQGWLYAAVANANNTFDGLYLTKDNGANWTQLRLPTEPVPSPSNIQYSVTPSNNTGLPDHDLTANAEHQLGNYALAMTIDPNDPNVVYLGGMRDGGGETSLIRVDSTFVHDPHAFFLSSDLPDGGQRRSYVNGPAVIKGGERPEFPNGNDPRRSPIDVGAILGAKINLYRDPDNPFDASPTIYVNNTASLANSGAGVRWTPFDDAIGQTTNLHRAFSLVDPLTGKGRLIFGVDRGIFTAVDSGDGTLLTEIGLGNMSVPTGSRNGNLQTAQIYFGAVQPSQAAADVAGALFYAQTDGNGFPRSGTDILEDGGLDWSSPRLITEAGSLSGSGVATDPTGSGASYQYNWRSGGDTPKSPPLMGLDFRTDFFLVDVTPGNGNPHDVVGRTTGLLQSSGGPLPDPQWPAPDRNAVIAGAPGGANFAVNPINADQVVISAPGSGRVFRTLDRGQNWFEVGVPSALGSSYFPALAFGAPEPDAEPGNIGDYIIGGNSNGQIYVTFTGGGAAGNQWIPLNNGDLEGNTAPFQAIATNPLRGSYEAYAITSNAVYHIADTRPSQGATWTNITSDLFSITHNIFGDENAEVPLLAAGGLRSLAVDWRYVIPNDFDNPPANQTDPDQTHPVLYVGGVGGVFTSYDDGASWLRFPSAFENSINTTPEDPGAGGGLPVAEVSDLDLSLGNISRATGLPVNQAGDPNLLMASTFGRGAYAIRLAPVVFPESLRLDLNGNLEPFNPERPPETRRIPLEFEGFSVQSAAGNTIEVRTFLIGDDGGLTPLTPLDDETTTDSAGRFRIRINPDDLGEDGLKRIGIQAVDGAGVAGNIALFDVILDTVPPEAPIFLDLQAASDSGISDSDNYTNALVTPPGIAAPTFDVGDVEAGATLRLLRNNVIVASISEAPGGVVSITDDGNGEGVPDGVHSYIAQVVDRAGNVSGDSPGLVVTIDTTPPAEPSVPTLLPADDTGVTGDGITNLRQPRLTGTIDLAPNELSDENRPRVQLILGGQVFGEAQVNADGSYVVRISVPLNDNDYVVQARAVDRAGNTSPAGPALNLTIDTSLPPDVSLGLSPVDDTGVTGDNITSIRRPRLIGTTGAGLLVELIDIEGTVPGSGAPGAVIGAPVTSQPNGAFTLRFPEDLPDGTYTIIARATTVAGNVLESDPLVLTILTDVPAEAPTLRIAPESDTGLPGDGVTTERRPFLIGEGDPNSMVEIVGPDGTILASGMTDAQGNYRLRLAGELSNGTITLRARMRGPSGVPGPFSAPLTLTIVSAPGDFDNDGLADLALYRPGQSDGESQFVIDRSSGDDQVIDSTAFRSSDPSSPLFEFELRPGDIPLSGDFDGDGVADVAVFRPDSDRMPGASEWFILGSRSGPRSVLFGGSGLDVPAAGDFDGDGITDLAVFRPVSDLLPGAAEWFILPSSIGQAYRVSFGAAGGLDLPAVADFDGDGRDDIAVFRPDSDLVPGAAQWFFLPSSSNDLSYSEMLDGYTVLFGEGGVDQPVPADFDGDGKADIATYRPTTSEWFLLRSSLPIEEAGQRVEFGVPGNIPAPADFDGDGLADLAVFLPTAGQWTIRQSTDGRDVVADFGTDGDVPLLAPLAFRDPRSDSIANPNPNPNPNPEPTPTTNVSALGLASVSTGQARRVTGPTLDLGRQASRLATSDSTDRARAGRVDPAESPVGRARGLLTDLLSRRLGGRPRA